MSSLDHRRHGWPRKHPPPKRIVIAGAGVAGTRCAFELRDRGFDGSVTLIGAEPHAAYDRTLLSKDFLTQGLDAADLALEPPAAYEDRGIERRPGTVVSAVRAAERRVVLADGQTLPYDRLVIATGARAVRPRALDHPRVFVLRDLTDAERLRQALRHCRRLVVVGGGFVGCELAAAAVELGIPVTLVESDRTPLARVLGVEVGALVAKLHRDRGVELRTGAAATRVRALADDELEVTLADGNVLVGDVVVLGAGSAPLGSDLSGFGETADGGILTDELCRTSVPDVLAAGDCARWWNPLYGTSMRVEHWDTAAHHGVAAARSALGLGEPFAAHPFFWSCQYGTRFQWIGSAPAWDSVDIEETGSAHSFVARYRKNGGLVAVLAANQPRAIAAARKELETLQPEEAA